MEDCADDSFHFNTTTGVTLSRVHCRKGHLLFFKRKLNGYTSCSKFSDRPNAEYTTCSLMA